MKFLSLFILLFVLSSCGIFKDNPDRVKAPNRDAEFPGGIEAMKKFLAENVNYPEISMEMGDQGKVFIEFIVEKDGSLTNVKILRGVSAEIDAESVRVIESMPTWVPAIHKRKYIRVRARIPINFKLV